MCIFFLNLQIFVIYLYINNIVTYYCSIYNMHGCLNEIKNLNIANYKKERLQYICYAYLTLQVEIFILNL